MPNYTSSKGQSGSGVLLYIGGPSGTSNEQFTVVGEVMELPVTQATWKTSDTTNLQSTIEEALKTLPGLTTVTIKGTRVPTDAGQLLMQAAYNAVGPYDFKITFPINKNAGQAAQGDVFTFSAIVLKNNFGPVKAASIVDFESDLQYVTLPVVTIGS